MDAEWIKGLLAVPFVLHSQPTGVFESQSKTVAQMAEIAHRRYAEIMQDVEQMIDDHIAHQDIGTHGRSKLKLLVPSIGTFFTSLPLADAFIYQDGKRFISSRRFVPPSFNDVRLILNTAQILGVTAAGPLELATFDGDVTLYDDGKSLEPTNPVIGRIISGESNFLFTYAHDSPYLLSHLPRRNWILPSMSTWTQPTITQLLDLAESSLRECIVNLSLPATILRKERAVGIIPSVPGYKFARESLEETVLVVQKKLEMSEVGQCLPFCAFNGGNDVFVDIGDKSWGVRVCQEYFGVKDARSQEKAPIRGERTLHVGDQFLSAGSNDFKARVVGTTAWIANPTETVELLDELGELMKISKQGS
ncbi:hypothetical protein B7494_g5039 [Chlorociboria aeruginascens]|nr:hypothetical protein B7494_g5039 [Chlorociboria aeruginascens]